MPMKYLKDEERAQGLILSIEQLMVWIEKCFVFREGRVTVLEPYIDKSLYLVLPP